MSNVSFIPGRWYVMDRLESTADRAYVAGPFASRELAEIDRTERNIADDCDVWQCPDSPPTSTQVHSLVHEVADVPQACHHCSSLESSARQTLAADGRIPAVDRCLGCGLPWQSKVSEPAPLADSAAIPATIARYADARGYSGLPTISATYVPGDGWKSSPLRPALTIGSVATMRALGITSVSVVWVDGGPADFTISELSPMVGLQGSSPRGYQSTGDGKDTSRGLRADWGVCEDDPEI